ncbi:MAG TPA: hypothetical protein VI792_03205 [Candidatus Eisenbacteria bacterium]
MISAKLLAMNRAIGAERDHAVLVAIECGCRTVVQIRDRTGRSEQAVRDSLNALLRLNVVGRKRRRSKGRGGKPWRYYIIPG